MACILHIETSTDVCSVALSEDGQILTKEVNREGFNHSVALAPFVEEAASFAESHAIPLDAVAVSQGPGSYTGLRIGVSTAKGLCYGRHIPLIGVSTLQLLCVPLLLRPDSMPEDAWLCPMLDARRMEVYCAVYDRALREQQPISAQVITEDSFAEILNQRPVLFFGNGAAKCKDIIRHSNAHFIEGIEPLAENMLPLAEKAYLQGEFKDVAYFEPFYLKEFVATQPKKLF